MAKHLVFVYGSLKRGGALHPELSHSKLLHEDSLPHFALYRVPGAWFPAIKKLDGYSVRGEVYEIDDYTLNVLDRIEGEGSLYNRTSVRTEKHPEGGVWAYVWADTARDLPLYGSNDWDVGRDT